MYWPVFIVERVSHIVNSVFFLISAIKKKCRELGIYNQIFKDFEEDMFNDLKFSDFDKIKTCQQIIANVQEARDRLLPKLMNGEIEV